MSKPGSFPTLVAYGFQSFISALQVNGHTLEEKDALAVRNAVLEAGLDDLPECLDRLVTVITEF